MKEKGWFSIPSPFEKAFNIFYIFLSFIIDLKDWPFVRFIVLAVLLDMNCSWTFLMFCFWFVNRVDWFTHIGAYGSNKSQIIREFCGGMFFCSIQDEVCLHGSVLTAFTQQADKSHCERAWYPKLHQFPIITESLHYVTVYNLSVSLILFVSFSLSVLPPFFLFTILVLN